MSRAEAVNQYTEALKSGKKYYNACIARGVSPYPQVLEDILSENETTGTAELGLTEIPISRIVGTWVSGRKSAFAGNFAPLLEINSEFATKWISLCASHLQRGISDPITCFEYLGKFYVKEGHKRVSVLKSFGSPLITAEVTRVIPAPSEKPEIKRYYEFLEFYKVCGLYQVEFTQPGGYARLQAALGYAPQQPWSEEDIAAFAAEYRRFSAAFDKLNSEKLQLAPGDALLSYLQVHTYSELQHMTQDEINDSLKAIWPDIRLLAQGEPISVSTAPEEKEKSLLGRILGTPRLQAAFIYDFEPQKSLWAYTHQQGQNYLEEKLGSQIAVRAYLCGDNPIDTMEQAVREGANVVFATTPTLTGACRLLAANHKNVAVYDCSLSMPYAGVRSYYCRSYESKFITGAIAGAMAREDRIGYVANYPIMGVTAAINAFALGARLTNPRARVKLRWSCLPGNPVQDFIGGGMDVISNRDEEDAHPFQAWNIGTYQVENGTLIPLASARWNWGIFYEKTMRSLLNGGIEAARDGSHAINDWWGLSTGAVDVEIADSLPGGTRQLADILKRGLISETIDPFLCPIRDQQGSVISDGSRRFTLEELMKMDWLCDNVDGHIPAFEELLPRSRNLVRLLGIYRESIPPIITEEAAL